MSTRREFIQLSALASAAAFMPGFLKELKSKPFTFEGKRLIIIQLSGGNDGLNAFVPYGDDAYYRFRPGLAIAQHDVLGLDDYQGLAPALTPLRSLYDNGELCLLNSVGYPNPDRSHFRAMDIWHSGSNIDEYWESGWLGRFLDNSCQGCAQPHKVLEIDDTLSLAVKGEKTKALAVRKPEKLYRSTRDPHLLALNQQYEPGQGSELNYLYKTLTETISSASYLHEKSSIYTSRSEYPNGKFGKQLKQVAELVISGTETQVYYVSLSGFDTHVRQQPQQERLLRQYSAGIQALVNDLKANSQWNNTLIMTFSEFGRRVSQNASGGTDHGKANNLWLMGGALTRPGIYNAAPDLSKLDDGDLSMDIDFREVYATVLNKWLGADDEKILRRKFRHLDIV